MWLIALRGRRRGEAAGLHWQDIDLDRRQLTIVSQRTTVGYQAVEGPPKSSASRRTIALDRRTTRILRTHLRQQRHLYQATGRTWRESGYVFTRPDGKPLHPNAMTKRLRFLSDACGLPPVKLHDLRHGAAALAHAAGADLKTVQDQLGHASIVLTADTYTSVLPTVQHKAAEATARLILTTARSTRAKTSKKNQRHTPQRPPQKPTTAAPASTPPAGNTAAQSTRKAIKRARKMKTATRSPQATTFHTGPNTPRKTQVKTWAAGDSNPEPMD